MYSTSTNPTRLRTLTIVALFAAFVGLVAAGIRADQASAAKETVVLGKDANMPDPLCPGSTCQAIPSVTGIQNNLPTGAAPFRMPFDGYVTAWKIFLSKPARSEQKFFNDMFGSPPQAGISILRKKSVSGRTKYELKKASPIKGLNPYLGTAASFKLEKPMKGNKGSLVALTVPTWAPALAAGNSLSGNNTWRASRDPGTCGAGDIDLARPQIKIGSLRFYSCEFTKSRLLYTVKITNEVGPTVKYCGTRPGDGAYNYVKVQGVDCTKGRSVYKGALSTFCKMKNDCSFAGSDKNRVYKGNVSYGNWDCSAKRARKEGNLRCTKSGGRVVYQAYSKS